MPKIELKTWNSEDFQTVKNIVAELKGKSQLQMSERHYLMVEDCCFIQMPIKCESITLSIEVKPKVGYMLRFWEVLVCRF